jgi:TRAP-type transport system small permease protein
MGCASSRATTSRHPSQRLQWSPFAPTQELILPTPTPQPADPNPPKITHAFHTEDEDIDLRPVTLEGWLSLAFFLLLGMTVFYQFFTRYALNNSAAWTEEIARYLLIACVFLALGIGVMKHSHVRVDFFYRFLPRHMSRGLALTVDVLCTVYYALCAVLTGLMMQKLGNYQMTIVDLPMNLIYGICLAGFALAAVRSVQVTLAHWRSDYAGVDEL